MEVKVTKKVFISNSPNKIGNTGKKLRQLEENTIEDKALQLTFRLTQIFEMQPILIKNNSNKTYSVRTSPVMYFLNIITAILINGVFLYALLISVILTKDSPRGPIAYSSNNEANDLLIAVAVIPLSVVSIYSTLFGIVRVRCILYCLEGIKKVKQKIIKLPYGHVPVWSSRKKMCCLILFATSWPLIFEGTGTWIKGFFGLALWACDILMIIVVLLEFQFLLLVELLNSSFEEINEHLNEALSQLSFEYTKRFHRTKIALKIHNLMICFVESCNMLRKLNSNESFLLLCHVVIFPLHILIRLYYLFYEIFNVEGYQLKPIIIICELVHCFYQMVKTIFVVEPCHQTEEKVDTTKHLVAELMCHLQSEDDPLFEPLDTFYKQLMMKKCSFTAMGICNIGRHSLSTSLGFAVTLIMVIYF